MKGIFTEELNEIEQLILKGKYKGALERVDSIISKKEISIEEKIKCKIFKYRIHSEKSLYSEAIKFGEEAFEESKELNNNLLMFDSLRHAPYIYFLAGEYELRKEKIKLAGQILESCENKESKEYLRRKAELLTMKLDSFEQSIENIEESIEISKKCGFDKQLADAYLAITGSYIWSGEYRKALNYAQKSLDLAEKIDYPWGECYAAGCVAICYMHMGELDLALDCFFKSKSFPEEINELYWLACLFLDLGYLYWLKKDLKLALEYYTKSVFLFKEARIVSTRHLPWTLFRMNLVLIEMDKYDEAYRNLEQIELMYLMKNKPIFKMIYHIAKAVLLKTKPDETSWNEAINLLEEVSSEDIMFLELNGLVIFHLCESYLRIIQKTNDIEIYEKLKNSVKRLKKMAEQQKSYILLVQSFLLQSKLELIEFNMIEGQLLLEKAQNIAEEKGIINLAKIISNEYDVLLDQLSKWEGMSTYLPSLEERFEFTHIEELLNKMIRNNVTFIDFADEKESPSFFLIMNQDGSVLFSESLSDVSLETELLQGIMAAIEEYRKSDELSGEVIKRLKYENYIVAVNSQKDILIIYAFIGKSYHALKKLKLLIEEFRSFTGEWNAYFEKIKDSVELSLDERMELSKYLESVFA